MPIAITDAIKTLAEAERRFGLGRCPLDGRKPSEDAGFFPEWRSDLLELTAGKVAIEMIEIRG